MQELDQFEGFDPEFCVDWAGLEWQGFHSIVNVYEPTDADLQEWQFLCPDEPKGMEPVRPNRGKNFDFEYCKRLAEVGMSSVQVAEIMGIEPYVVNNNIRARYNCGWKEYSSRWKLSCRGDIMLRIIETCRQGNQRALAIFAMKLVGGALAGIEPAPRYPAGPVSVEEGSTPLLFEATEDLQKRRLQFMAVIDRPSAFVGLEKLTSTLKVVEGWHEIDRSQPAMA